MSATAYRVEHATLRELFPRGRFVEDADGTDILRALRSACVKDHVFVQAPGKLLGVYYVGSPRRYLSRLAGLVERHLAGDGEGILHVRWCQEAAAMLPWFNLKAPCYRGSTPERMAELARIRQASIMRANHATGSRPGKPAGLMAALPHGSPPRPAVKAPTSENGSQVVPSPVPCGGHA